MNEKEIYKELVQYKEIYELLHAQTAEVDLDVLRMLAAGNSVTQVSMQIPCAESSVYRSKKRVAMFLEEELYNYLLTQIKYINMPRSIALAPKKLSLAAMKLYYLLIAAYQSNQNVIRCKDVHTYLPGLRNRKQRDAVVVELNNFTLVPAEEPKHTLKIFAYVKYDNAKYSFALTESARPYFDLIYAAFTSVESKHINR